MGNDPSKGAGRKGSIIPVAAGAASKEGNVPYTSYSVDRRKDSQVKDIRSQNGTDIVTVVEVNSGARQNVEPELQALQRIATFEPLVKQSGWVFTGGSKSVPEMDSQALLKLCGEYQSFCRKSAAVVSQQQTLLCARIRAKEQHAQEAYRTLHKHLSDVRQFEMNFRDVEKIHLQINTTKILLTQVIAKVEEVCSQLPQKYQLSPIRSFIVDRSLAPKQDESNEPDDEKQDESETGANEEGERSENGDSDASPLEKTDGEQEHASEEQEENSQETKESQVTES